MIESDQGVSSSDCTFTVENGNMVSGEAGFSFDSHQQRASSPGGDALSGEVLALETQCESAFLFTNRNTL